MAVLGSPSPALLESWKPRVYMNEWLPNARKEESTLEEDQKEVLQERSLLPRSDSSCAAPLPLYLPVAMAKKMRAVVSRTSCACADGDSVKRKRVQQQVAKVQMRRRHHL